MPTSNLHRRPGSTARAYTLVELLITLAAFGLVGGIVFSVFQDGFNQFIRNISINKSENSLRFTLQRLKRDITLAVQSPTLVSYDPTRSTPLMAVQSAPSGLTFSSGIRLFVNPGPAYCLAPGGSATDDGSKAPLPPDTLSFRLFRHVPTGSNGSDPAPLPFIDVTASAAGNYSRNDRLMFLLPAAPVPPNAPPWPASTQQIIREGTTPAVVTTKPGRRITAMNLGGPNSTYFDVTVEDLRPTEALPGINPYNSAYIVHEVAYAVFTTRDAAGNGVTSELRYFPSADDPSNFTVVCRDLDPNPQEMARDDLGNLVLDAGGKPQPVQPFTVKSGNASNVRVNLPIRARDYAKVIAESRMPAGGGPNVSSEFNVSISSKPQMGNRTSVR